MFSDAKDRIHDIVIAAKSRLTAEPVGDKLINSKDTYSLVTWLYDSLQALATASLDSPAREFSAGSVASRRAMSPDRNDGLFHEASHHVFRHKAHNVFENGQPKHVIRHDLPSSSVFDHNPNPPRTYLQPYPGVPREASPGSCKMGPNSVRPCR